MKITGRTAIAGIFGDPVEHTLSPAMHNASFEVLGLDMVYLPFHVRPEALRDAVKAVRALGMRGVNVTIPHKERVLKYLDSVDDFARRVGAVNTVLNKDGVLHGYNTDGPGYLLSLREETGFTPKGKRVLVLGAGGAARAIIYSLLAGGASTLVIANRTRGRALSLKREFGKKFKGTEVRVSGFDTPSLEEEAPGTDLLVNTTTLGMEGGPELDFPVALLPLHAVVSDIVYRPLVTTLLRKAKERGLKTHDGLSMLVRQGALSFELWTGKMPPLDIMRKAALEALG